MFIFSRNRGRNALIWAVRILIWLLILFWAFEALSGHSGAKQEVILPDCQNSWCNEWIVRLADCESSGRWWIKIIDTNGKISYGGLQFQLDTFREWGVKSGVLEKGITASTAEELVMRKELSSKVALYMRDQGVSDQHWVICSEKMKSHEWKVSKTD